MIAHTPGPWTVARSEGGDVIVVHEEDTICTVDPGLLYHQVAPDRRVIEANARLIAAAPMLLEALIQARVVISDLVLSSYRSLNEIEAYSAIKKAIAQAEQKEH